MAGDIYALLRSLEDVGVLSVENNDISFLMGDVESVFKAETVRIYKRVWAKHHQRYISEIRAARAKEGLEYILDTKRNIGLFRFQTPMFSVGVGVEETSRCNYRVAVCFCTPEDASKWRNRVARELLGYRLKNSPILFLEDEGITSAMDVAVWSMNHFLSMSHEATRGVSLPMFFLKKCSDYDAVQICEIPFGRKPGNVRAAENVRTVEP
jgi:hypothetical protein